MLSSTCFSHDLYCLHETPLAGAVPIHFLARDRQAIYRRMPRGSQDTADAEERERML